MTYYNRRRPNYGRTNFSTPSPRVLTADGQDAGYSVAQQGYLNSLVTQLTDLLAPLDDSDPLAVSTVAAFTPLLDTVDKVAASEYLDVKLSSTIDALKGMVESLRSAPRIVAQVAAQQRAQHPGLPVGVTKVITTKYSYDCVSCGAPGVVGTDLAVYHNGRWASWCLTCADTDPVERRARLDAERAAAAAAAAAVEQARLDVLDRIATVRALCGHGPESKATVGLAIDSKTPDQLDFLRIKSTQVLRVIGGHADQPLAPAQALPLLDRIIALTADERRNAAHLFGTEQDVCGRCGKHLTKRDSVLLGLGPDCATKAWF